MNTSNAEVLAMDAEAAGDYQAAFEIYRELSTRFVGQLRSLYISKAAECAMRIATLRKAEEIEAEKWDSFFNPNKLRLVVNNG